MNDEACLEKVVQGSYAVFSVTNCNLLLPLHLPPKPNTFFSQSLGTSLRGNRNSPGRCYRRCLRRCRCKRDYLVFATKRLEDERREIHERASLRQQGQSRRVHQRLAHHKRVLLGGLVYAEFSNHDEAQARTHCPVLFLPAHRFSVYQPPPPRPRPE